MSHRLYGFFMNAQRFLTDKPSMIVADIIKMTDSNTLGHFVEDRNDEWIYFGHGETVDLTSRPHFFILLPATWGPRLP